MSIEVITPPGTGLAKQYGTPNTRDKRGDVSARRFVRKVGHGAVLRPACGCALPFATHIGDPLVCPTCGGARLTAEETHG